jgi:hypothetical protein
MNAVVILDPGTTPEERAFVLQAIDTAAGTIELGLGTRAAVVSGGHPLLDVLGTLAGVAAVVSAAADVPAELDDDTTDLVLAWLATQDAAFQAELADPTRYGKSWATLESAEGDVEP